MLGSTSHGVINTQQTAGWFTGR